MGEQFDPFVPTMASKPVIGLILFESEDDGQAGQAMQQTAHNTISRPGVTTCNG